MNGRQAPEVIALGEALVEVMRPRAGIPLDTPGPFEGPFPSGAPADFASACARLGLSTGFIGSVGDDAFGRLLRGRLAGDGVDLTHLLVDPERATGTAFVTYRADGGRDFLFHLKHAAASRVPEIDPAYFARARLVHVTGSTLASSREWRAACLRAARLGKEAGARVSFDPNIRPELLGGESLEDVCGPIVDLSDVVLPSGKELAMLAGSDDVEQAVRILLQRGVAMVILKEGPRGSTLFTRDAAVHVPTRAREERDPTGAGDAFAGAIAYGLLHGSGAGAHAPPCQRRGRAGRDAAGSHGRHAHPGGSAAGGRSRPGLSSRRAVGPRSAAPARCAVRRWHATPFLRCILSFSLRHPGPGAPPAARPSRRSGL